MHSRTVLLSLLTALACVPSFICAQVTNTSCNAFGTQLNCTSTTMQPPAEPNWAQIGQNIRAIIDARRQARAAEEAQRLSNQASAQAAAREQAVFEARQRLFIERWTGMLRAVGDSVRVYGEVYKRLEPRLFQTASDLFLVKPEASTAEMRAALEPQLQLVLTEFRAFVARSVAPNQPALDTMRFTPAQVQVFLQALQPFTYNAFMLEPDQDARTYDQKVLQPMLVRARFYFDSLRTDSIARSAPPPKASTRSRRP